MKFFHVTTLFRITQGYNHNNYSYYEKLLALSNETAKKHINEPEYTRIVFNGQVDHIQDVFRKSLLFLHKLWKENYPCNILYTGPDVMFFQTVSFSDKFDRFMMFNYTDPRSGFGFSDYFNADVKYYPSTMKEELWDIALKMEREWPSYTFWDYEQTIWNKMLWSQSITLKECLNPEYNYMVISTTNTSEMELANTNVPVSRAKVVHLCGTRRLPFEWIQEFVKKYSGVQ